MKLSRLLRAAALGLATAFAAFAPSGATQIAGTTADAELGVVSIPFGGQSLTAISLGSRDAIVQVRLVVPEGYAVDLSQAAGTELGYVSALVADAAGTSSPAFVNGDLVVDDPAKYAADAVAQACAPGAHAAVWRAELSALGQSFSFPVFLDPAGPSDSGSAAVLRFCPTWSSQSVPSGLAARSVTIFVEGALTPPTSPGRYTWSALLVPAVPGSVNPDAPRTFELRSVVPLPHTLTLRARHDPKAKSVVLSGRLTAVGEPEPGVEITFGASVDSESEEFTFFGPVKTNAAGEFSIRRHIERTTQFAASAAPETRSCSAPSTAPAGCLAETVSAPLDASVVVRVRTATDPKLERRARDQALARRIGFKLSDFPPGWQAFTIPMPFVSCPGFKPNLSKLTATGEAESPVFVSELAAAWSRSSIYVTDAQARTAFGREARLAAARCFADDLVANGYTLLQLSSLRFPSLGSETRAFRVVASDREDVVNLDLVSFRRGRAVVHMGFASAVQPLLIAESLAAKAAARARGA